MVGAMLRAGQDAPDFRVGERSLRELLAAGGVVVFFFPKAFTPG